VGFYLVSNQFSLIGVSLLKTKKIRRTILTNAILAVGYLGGRNNVLQNVFPATVATEQPAKQTPPVSPDYQAIADQDF